MKQVLSMNYAMVGGDILSHPSTIYTDDDVKVTTFNTEDQLITYIAGMNNDFPPLPNEGDWCEMNQIYQYGTDKVKCLQGHNRMSFPIEQIPGLFLIIPTVIGYPVWVQPTGAHDAYQKGDRVTFNGNDYESVIDANIWSPAAYPAGWKQI